MNAPTNPSSEPTGSIEPRQAGGEASGHSDWFGARPFVGRASDLDALRGHLVEALDEGGRVLFLVGEPGMGKSALIRRFIARMRMRGIDIGYADAADPEHGAWRQLARGFTLQRRTGKALLRALPDWLEVVPVLGRLIRAVVETVLALLPHRPEAPRGEVGTGSAVDAVRTMLAHGPETPRLIILDNMEAADAAELSGAFALIQKISGTRTLLLIAVRTRGGEMRAELRDLASETERLGVGRFHRLEGLSASEVAAALERSSRDRLPPEWRAWFSAAGPLPPGELWGRMAELAGTGAVVRVRFWWLRGKRWTWVGEPPEPSRRAVELPHVTPEERRLLAAAARLGQRFPAGELAERLGMAELELADRLDRLARRGIVDLHETVELGGELTDVYGFPDRARMESWRDDPAAGR